MASKVNRENQLKKEVKKLAAQLKQANQYLKEREQMWAREAKHAEMRGYTLGLVEADMRTAALAEALCNEFVKANKSMARRDISILYTAPAERRLTSAKPAAPRKAAKVTKRRAKAKRANRKEMSYIAPNEQSYQFPQAQRNFVNPAGDNDMPEQQEKFSDWPL